jgi:hypothetical protein
MKASRNSFSGLVSILSQWVIFFSRTWSVSGIASGRHLDRLSVGSWRISLAKSRPVRGNGKVLRRIMLRGPLAAPKMTIVAQGQVGADSERF